MIELLNSGPRPSLSHLTQSVYSSYSLIRTRSKPLKIASFFEKIAQNASIFAKNRSKPFENASKTPLILPFRCAKRPKNHHFAQEFPTSPTYNLQWPISNPHRSCLLSPASQLLTPVSPDQTRPPQRANPRFPHFSYPFPSNDLQLPPPFFAPDFSTKARRFPQ